MASIGERVTAGGLTNTEDKRNRTYVLGVGVDPVNLKTATARIVDWIQKGVRSYVTVSGVHGVMEAQQDPEFKTILNNAGLTVPDGMPLVWLSRLAGKKQTRRTYGPNLTLHVSNALAAHELSAFYYGGAPGVADQFSEVLAKRFPGLKTAGTYCPPFRTLTKEEKKEVVEKINRSGASVVWVGLSTPKQEKWMAEFRQALNVPVLIGVGAAFDFHTGRVRQAPRWIQNSGLEWLFRLIMEPRRLWKRYLGNNPRFVYYLLLEQFGLRSFALPRKNN